MKNKLVQVLKFRKKYNKWPYLLIGFFAFFYAILRVFFVGVTYDEVWTIIGFIPHATFDIFINKSGSANNHIVNSLLIKFFYWLFSSSSLYIARVPNLLAFLMFLFFSYKITSSYLSKKIGVVCFFLLVINPFFLDFFSLARGYGLAHGFMMASLFYFIQYCKGYKIKFALLAIFLGGIAVISSFSLLNYWVSLLGVMFFIFIISENQYKSLKLIIYSLLLVVFFILIFYNPINNLLIQGNLYYGGSLNFYEDSLVSLTKYSMYSSDETGITFAVLNIFLLVFVFSICVSYLIKKVFLSLKTVLLSLLILIILSTIVQHYVFGTLYLIDRTTLFMYPLLILVLCFSIEEYKEMWFGKVVWISVSIFFCVNFIQHANLYKSAIWFFDSHTVTILNKLNEKGKKENKIINVDFSWPVKSSIAYYAERNNFPFLNIVKKSVERYSINPNWDVYIHLSKTIEEAEYFSNKIKLASYKKDTLMEFKKENIIVYIKVVE